MADLQFNITAVFEQASVAFRQLADDLDTVKKKVDELNAAKGEVEVAEKGADEVKAKAAEVKAIVADLDKAKATPEITETGADETKVKAEEVKAEYQVLDKTTARPEINPKVAPEGKKNLDEIFDDMDRLKGKTAEPEVTLKGAEEVKLSEEQIKAGLDALKAEHVEPEITVRTVKAEEQVGAFANKMRLTLQAAIKSLPEVDLTMKLEATEFETRIQEIRGELAAMQNFVVKGEFDDEEFLFKLHELLAELKAANTEGLNVRAKFDLAAAMAQIESFITVVKKGTELNISTKEASATIGAFATSLTAKLDAAIKALPVIEIKGDSTPIERTFTELRAQMASFRELVIEGKMNDEDFMAKAAEMEATLKFLSGFDLTVKAKFELASALAQFEAFRTEVEKKLEVNVGTDKAAAEIGAFATGVKTKIEAAIKSLPEIHLTAESTQAEQRMAAVKALLESLKDKRIGVDISKERFDASMAVINAELTALSGKNIDIPVRVDADSARTALKGIGSDLDEAKAKTNSFSSAIDSFAGVMSTKMGLIGGSIQPLLASIGQLSGALGLLPAIATAVGTGFAAVKIGTEGVSQAIQNFSKIEDLATKASDASAKAQQAQATATQANTAAGQGNVAALKQQVTAGQAHVDSLKAQGSATAAQKAAIAGAQQQLFGYEAALKNAQVANTGNTSAQNTSVAATKAAQQATTQANSAQNTYNKALEAFKVSLGNLAPNAQSFVMALVGMNQTFKDLKIDVQQHLFEGLGSTLQGLASGPLSVVRTGLVQMADAINTAVKDVASFIQQQSSITAWREIFTNVATAATNLAGAIKPILQIITDVTQVGSRFLPGLASGFANAAQSAADFVSKAKDTGQLAQWIQTGITAVGQLWDAFKNVVAIIADLAAAPGFSPSFLATLDAVTSGIRWITDNVPAATTVVNLFFTAWVFAKVLSGITGMVTSISGMGLAIDGLVAKLAALTGGEIAAGAAGTTVAAGFTGMLLPLAALALAITVMVTHWNVVVQGFKDMGTAVVASAGIIVDGAKAVADAVSGDFGAAGRALVDAGSKWTAMMAQLSDHSSFDSAGQAANALTGSINGIPTHKDITFGADINPATNAILRMNAAAQAAAWKQWLIKFDGNADGVGEAARKATDYARGVPQPPLSKFTGDASGVQGASGQAKTAATGVPQPPKANFLGDPQSILSASGQAKAAATGVPQPPVSHFQGDPSNLQTIVDSVKNWINGVPQPQPSKFTGDPSGATSAANQVTGAIKAVPPPPISKFTGDPSDVMGKISTVVDGMSRVVTSWLTNFLGNASNLEAVIGGAQAGITGVPLTHGPTVFTGDPSNLVAGAGQASTAAEGVPLTHGPTVFSADITNLTAGTGQASTSVGTVPSTHPTTLTADPSNLVAGVGTASTAVSGMDPSHNTDLNATDNSTSVIQSIVNALATLVDKTITITTVYQSVGGAGGMIATPMAAGGVIEMASGGELSPNMSGSTAKMIPPNTWRVVGDRMIDDEAFIPINNSAASLAILGEAATRMGHTLAPMHGGGYWHHGGGGGTPPPVPAQSSVPIYEIASHYATSNVNFGVGRTAAITKMVSGYQATGRYSIGNIELAPTSGGSGGGTPPPVHVHCHFDALGLGDFESSFMTWLRKNVRVQGGDVQRVFG